MKKRTPVIILIFCLLTTSLFTSGAARADDGELPDPGMTPDSPFYFLDTIGKKIDMFFTFGADVKARKALEFAEERLAEAREMAARNRFREMERAAEDYDRYLNMCNERLREINQPRVSESISERLAIATGRHLEIIDGVIDKTPEADAAMLRRARTASQNGQVNALRALAEAQPERAVDIAANTVENCLERARIRAFNNSSASDIAETLDYTARLTEVEDEIMISARSSYEDVSSIEQRLSQITTYRDSTITDIMTEISVSAVRNATEDTLNTYESTIEQIMDKRTNNNLMNETTAVSRRPQEQKEDIKPDNSNRRQAQSNTTDNTSTASRTRPANEASIR